MPPKKVHSAKGQVGLERQLKALKLMLIERIIESKEKKFTSKYRMVKHFDRKKVERAIKKAERQVSEAQTPQEKESSKQKLYELQIDYNYIMYFPKGRKYMSLYPTTDADNPNMISRRNKIRELIREAMENSELDSLNRHLEQSQYKLIELTPEIAALFDEIRIQGEEFPSLCIKAALPHEEPILCTKDKTFTIRKQHYSNSLLLLSPSLTFVPNVRNRQRDEVNDVDMIDDFEKISNDDSERVNQINIDESEESSILRAFEVVDVLNYFCELTLSAPKIEQLNELLQPTIYKGPEEESGYKDKKFYTFDELDNLVQASVKELKQALESKFALEIDGYWRYIDHEYVYDIFSTILSFIDLFSAQLESISLKNACDAVNGYGHPKFIIQHIFECFSESIDFTDESNPIFKLSKEKVCRFFGIHVLKDMDKLYNERIPLDLFFESWDKAVPFEDNAIIFNHSLNHLIGRSKKNQLIRYFPVSKLSSSPKQRFKQLFSIKSEWREDFIKPFLVDFCLDSDKFSTKKFNELLLEYTKILYLEGRIYREEGMVFYTSKWPISLI
ncbi:11762_t:CDS:10 [Dentiscutata erythropus]|uniref:11762_t:CDS:1 n=1 Tax=Dentiscutata erythropus TaxID=1348616 RepID=A0A9N8W6Q5_9GLOM|nr:11762_t:CDS:10 [Dentiscutata erythropus]